MDLGSSAGGEEPPPPPLLLDWLIPRAGAGESERHNCVEVPLFKSGEVEPADGHVDFSPGATTCASVSGDEWKCTRGALTGACQGNCHSLLPRCRHEEWFTGWFAISSPQKTQTNTDLRIVQKAQTSLHHFQRPQECRITWLIPRDDELSL